MARRSLGGRICLAIAFGACLSACGQKGPLTLPEEPAIALPADANGTGTDERTRGDTEENED